MVEANYRPDYDRDGALLGVLSLARMGVPFFSGHCVAH